MTRLVLSIVVSCVAVLPVARSQDASSVRDKLDRAVQALQQGHPRDALSALREVEAVEPRNPWLWYLRGTADRTLGNPHNALEAYDRALDCLAKVGEGRSALADEIRRLRRDTRRDVFDLSLQTGLFFDSNVTFSGDDVTGQFVSGREDVRFGTMLHFGYAPLANETDSLALGGSLSSAWHASVEDFNYQEYGAFARYSRKLTPQWVIDVQYDYDISYLGNEPFLSSHGLSPRVSYRWRNVEWPIFPSMTALDYRLEARDFLFEVEPALDRDGFANSLGLTQRFQFNVPKCAIARCSPARPDQWLWNLDLAYRLETVATEGSEFDHLSNLFGVSLGIPMQNPLLKGKDASILLHADWEIADYDHPSIIDGGADERSGEPGDEREDLITRVGLVFSQQLVDDIEYGELTLRLIVDWNEYESNIRTDDGSEPFSYDKVLAGVQLAWRF